MWKLCEFIYNNTGKTGDHSNSQLVVNNNAIIKDTEKTDIFNDYFNSMSQVISNPLAEIDEPLVYCDYELSNIFISDQDVKDVLQNLKTNKASGIDMVNHLPLKESANIITKPLALLFNKSLNMGRFPGQWKMANVVPIHKCTETHIFKIIEQYHY